MSIPGIWLPLILCQVPCQGWKVPWQLLSLAKGQLVSEVRYRVPPPLTIYQQLYLLSKNTNCVRCMKILTHHSADKPSG